MIGPGVAINGDIISNEELTIEGPVTCSKISVANNTLIIGKDSVINAELEAKILNVFGKVTGNLRATEAIFLGPTAVVHGDAHAPKIHLDDHADLDGRIIKKG